MTKWRQAKRGGEREAGERERKNYGPVRETKSFCELIHCSLFAMALCYALPFFSHRKRSSVGAFISEKEGARNGSGSAVCFQSHMLYKV